MTKLLYVNFLSFLEFPKLEDSFETDAGPEK